MDRRFIDKYMPELAAWLHYRTVDVSSIKELARTLDAGFLLHSISDGLLD